MENIKEVPYFDKSYIEKRKILRRQHFVDKDIVELTNKILFKIIKKIKPNKFVDYKELIKILLIDGYAAYEKIYDKNDNLISLSPIDPISLTYTKNDKKFIWNQNKGTSYARVLTDSQVLYITSGLDSYTSLVEMRYMNFIDDNSKYSLKNYINYVVNSYNNIFTNLK